jgi:hypothetical protein
MRGRDTSVYGDTLMSETPEDLEAQAARIMASIVLQRANDPPRIDDSSFSESDRRRIDTLLLMMNHLNSLIERFATDLELFDYAEAQQLGHRWSSVACRDAALALKDFKDALSYITRAAKECLRLCTPALLNAIEAAQRSFDLATPGAVGSRHIAAHSSEQVGTHDDRRRNTLSNTPILMHMVRSGRRITSTRQGREVSFEISVATLDTLKSVRAQVFEAIRARQGM